MRDVRELILVRLREIIATVPGIGARVGRNQADITGGAPAILLHDGEEQVEGEGGGQATGSAPRPPRGSRQQFVTMKPQITIMAAGSSDTVGTTLNGLRVQVLSLVLNDDILIGLVYGSGGVRAGDGEMRYDGCVLETEAGEAREGRLDVNFSLTYVLRLSDLQ